MNARMTKKQFLKLQEMGIRHFDEIIHDQSKDWLLKNFSEGADEYPVNVSKLMRNIIWQTRERIINKKREPLKELIRTFWYMHIKPTLARAGALSQKTDQYNQLINNLVYLVVDQKMMKYRDIGFRDDGQANRQVGINANVILFAEKVGHQEFLKEMASIYQISTIALGGQPSALTMEYFVEELRKQEVNLQRSFYLFSIVDYDTSGWIIRDAFINNLHAFGVKNTKVVDLIHPDMLTEEEIRFSRYKVPDGKEMKKKNTKWMRQVKQAKYKNQRYLESRSATTFKRSIYGLEAESISSKRLEQAIEAELTPLVGKSEQALKTKALEKLNQSLDRLILHKIR